MEQINEETQMIAVEKVLEEMKKAEEFVMANTDKTAVEIEWQLGTPVREDIYEYIVNT